MKVIVAHSGWQHSAHLALALQKAGYLSEFITTVYSGPQSRIIKMLSKLPINSFRNGISTHLQPFLPDEKVCTCCTVSGLLSIVLSHLRWFHLYELNERQLNWRFGRKVAKMAERCHVDAVVMYEGKAATTFKYLLRKNPNIVRIIDSASACSIYVDRKMQEEYSAVNSNASFFKSLLLMGKHDKRVTREMRLADKFLVASNYARDSFVESGLDSSKVMVCAYGGNFPVKKTVKEPPINRPLRFVYCGRCTSQKGVHHLLEAFCGRKELLRLVGVYDEADPYLKRWVAEPNIEFVGKVPHEQVVKHLDWADVFIFPSLSDGLSLACAEAACRGLPLVCTDRTGISDYVRSGVNGFVVPAGDTNALANTVEWFTENPEKIPSMSSASLEMARTLTWERYEHEIGELFLRELGGEGSCRDFQTIGGVD